MIMITHLYQYIVLRELSILPNQFNIIRTNNEIPDHTARIYRLISAFAVRTQSAPVDKNLLQISPIYSIHSNFY